MDLKKLLVFCCIALAILVSVEPAGALLWPPVIGTCGLGGLFGPFGLNGPFGPYGIYNACGLFPTPFGVPFGGYGLGACGAGLGFPC
jgi:hypothetical protein